MNKPWISCNFDKFMGIMGYIICFMFILGITIELITSDIKTRSLKINLFDTDPHLISAAIIFSVFDIYFYIQINTIHIIC